MGVGGVTSGAGTGGRDAIGFAERLVSLLDTGRFTATYKYALLVALIDECLEAVGERGEPPAVLSAKAVGRRVFALYWPQARPMDGVSLRQSTQAGDLVAKIEQFKRDHGVVPETSLEQARATLPEGVAALERDIVTTVIRMPIPRLQRFGGGASATEQRFVYDYAWPDEVAPSRVRRADFDDRLRLVGGAGEWLIAMAGVLRPLVQQQWASFVADRNRDRLYTAYLEDFLFGADRVGLEPVRRPLAALQRGACFYCLGELRGRVEVDHFLPWSKHPDNALDNLVAAHAACNNAKRAALAATAPHLSRWARRFAPGAPEGRELGALAASLAWPSRPGRTLSAARALYLRVPAGAPLWVRRGEYAPNDPAATRAALVAIGGSATRAAEELEGYDL